MLQARGDRAVHGRGRRGEEAGQRACVAEPVGMERRQRHRAVTALGGADDAVPVGREALVGGQPVRQFAGQEGVPLLAAVRLPVGVHAPGATGGRDHRDALAREGVHRVARGHPVADVGGSVEGVQQNDGVRAARLEGHRNVASHRRRRHLQELDARGLGECGLATHNADGQRRSRPSSRNNIESSLIPTSIFRRSPMCTLVPARRVVNHITTTGRSGNDRRRRPHGDHRRQPSSLLLVLLAPSA